MHTYTIYFLYSYANEQIISITYAYICQTIFICFCACRRKHSTIVPVCHFSLYSVVEFKVCSRFVCHSYFLFFLLLLLLFVIVGTFLFLCVFVFFFIFMCCFSFFFLYLLLLFAFAAWIKTSFIGGCVYSRSCLSLQFLVYWEFIFVMVLLCSNEIEWKQRQMQANLNWRTTLFVWSFITDLLLFFFLLVQYMPLKSPLSIRRWNYCCFACYSKAAIYPSCSNTY